MKSEFLLMMANLAPLSLLMERITANANVVNRMILKRVDDKEIMEMIEFMEMMFYMQLLLGKDVSKILGTDTVLEKMKEMDLQQELKKRFNSNNHS